MEAFIKIIRRFPCLWNTDSKHYRDTGVKEYAWNKIVDELKCPEIPDSKTAKVEWKKLRDSHRDSLKRIKSSIEGQEPVDVPNKWKYADAMSFLLPFIKNRKKCYNLTFCPDLEESYSPTHIMTRVMTSVEAPVTNSHELPTHPEHNNDSDENLVYPTENGESRKRNHNAEESDWKAVIKEINDNYNHCMEERINERAKEERSKNAMNLFFNSMCETTKQFPNWLQHKIKKQIFAIISEAEESLDQYSQESFTSPPSGMTLQGTDSIGIKLKKEILD